MSRDLLEVVVEDLRVVVAGDPNGIRPHRSDNLALVLDELERLRRIEAAARAYVNGPDEAPRESDGSYGDLGDEAPEVLYGRLVELVGGTS